MAENNAANKKIFILSLPIFVELFLQMLVGNIDQIMLSNYSQDSVAAIVNSNQILNLAIMILTMFSSAGMIMITHFIGAKDNEKASDTFFASFLSVEFAALVLALILTFLGKPLLRALNVPLDIVDEAYSYLLIVGWGLLIQGAYLSFSTGLRSYSRLISIMICSIIMNVVNIIGNYLLINGVWIFPPLGIVGAAISTVASKGIGLIIITVYFAKKLPIKISVKNFIHFPKSQLKKLIKIAIPTGGESASYNFAQIIILSFINLFGKSVIATKGYCSIFANVAYLYSIAIAQSTQIIVGYLYGANDTKTIRKRVDDTTFICIGVSVAVTIIIYLFSDFAFSVFTPDKAIWQLGKQVLLVEIFLEMGRSVNIVMTRCLMTLNDIYFPVFLGIVSQWVLSVGLSYLFGVVLNYGLVGIWVAMAIDEIVRGIIFEIRFHVKSKKGFLPTVQ